MNNNQKAQKLNQQLENKKQQTILKWETALYTEYERGTRWYFLAILISISTIILSLIFGSKTFALVVIAISIIYFLQAKKEVPHVEAIVTPVGIHFGKQFHKYDDIDFFWIEKHLPNFQSLHLNTTKGHIKDIEIQFYDFTDQELINTLQRFIPYNPNKKPGLIDHLVHILKL